MATTLPFDLQTEQDAIAQRKAMAQLLMQQGMQQPQGQMVSGHYVAPNLLSALAPALKMFMAGKMGDQVKDDQSALAGKYNTALGEGMQKYFATREGNPGVPMGPPTEDGQMGMPTGAVKADPRRAAIEAMTSGLSPLQQLGQADLQGLSKQEQETFGHTPVQERNPAGGLQQVLYGNRGTRRVVEGATPYEKPMAVGDRVIDPTDPTKPLADYRTKGGETKTINGDLYQLYDDGKWHKLDNSTKVSVGGSTTIIPGQRQGYEEWSKMAAKTVSELADKARGGVKLMGTLNQLDNLSAKGVFQGPTANAATFLSSLGESLGLPIDKDRLANSQTFASTAQEAVQNIIAQLGGNRSVTAAEAEQIAQMSPTLLQTPQGRMQLTAILRKAAQRQIDDAKQAQAEYGKALRTQNPESFTFGLGSAQLPNTEPMPVVPGSAAPTSKPTRSGW